MGGIPYADSAFGAIYLNFAGPVMYKKGGLEENKSYILLLI